MIGGKQILFVGNDGLQHYLYKGHSTFLQDEYGWDHPDLVRDLTAALQQTGRNVPVLILSDQTEQQYRKDVLPKASMFDRKKMIDRKLTMAFPQVQYKAFLPLKSAGRDADANAPNVLFAGVPQTPELAKVLQAVTDSEAILDDIVLVPVEAVPMINRLIKTLHERTHIIDRPRWTVLLTQHKTGGLRQIVLHDGELALTRLTPVFIGNNSELGHVRDMILKEFQATLTYLARFGYVAADGMDVIVITSDMLGEGLQQANMPVTHLYTLSVSEATRILKQGPKIAGDSFYSDGLLAAVAAGSKSVLPLQSPSLQVLQQGRKAIWLASIAMVFTFFGLCGMASKVFVETNSVNAKNETSENDMRILQVRYNDLAQKLNTLKYKPEMVQAVLNVYNDLIKTNMNTEPTIQAIDGAIDKSQYILQDINIEPAKTDAQTAGGPPPAPPLDQMKPTYPPRITVTLTIAFPDPNQAENNARLTELLEKKLSGIFTQHQVRITKIVGNLSVDQTVSGLSQQVMTGEPVNPDAKRNDISQIEITGVAL